MLALPPLELPSLAGASFGGLPGIRQVIGGSVNSNSCSPCRGCPPSLPPALQVLRYTEGQKYEPHHDYFSDPVNKQYGGHRYATVLMYLNNVTLGGETVFPTARDDTPKDDSWSDCAKGYLAGTAPATEKKTNRGELPCVLHGLGGQFTACMDAPASTPARNHPECPCNRW